MAGLDVRSANFASALRDIYIKMLRKIVEERREDLFEIRQLKKDVLVYFVHAYIDLEDHQASPKSTPGFLRLKERKFDYAYAEVYVLIKTLNYLIALEKIMLNETKNALKKEVKYDYDMKYWDMYDSFQDRSECNIFNLL